MYKISVQAGVTMYIDTRGPIHTHTHTTSSSCCSALSTNAYTLTQEWITCIASATPTSAPANPPSAIHTVTDFYTKNILHSRDDNFWMDPSLMGNYRHWIDITENFVIYPNLRIHFPIAIGYCHYPTHKQIVITPPNKLWYMSIAVRWTCKNAWLCCGGGRYPTNTL